MFSIFNTDVDSEPEEEYAYLMVSQWQFQAVADLIERLDEQLSDWAGRPALAVHRFRALRLRNYLLRNFASQTVLILLREHAEMDITDYVIEPISDQDRDLEVKWL